MLSPALHHKVMATPTQTKGFLAAVPGCPANNLWVIRGGRAASKDGAILGGGEVLQITLTLTEAVELRLNSEQKDVMGICGVLQHKPM